ncbi:hypothetical protein [Streptomyces zingiberis]|uniref:Uncharacterized protein n=1 Tax=Streptomyces zingiberis TaxID=2053010 RepID=A0ABX1BZ12_9ACTN|nr:hypothetical protein [Streptomyces zingiberis]NJP99898.1 hypothetical protein [Streptomyces zingiberis]
MTRTKRLLMACVAATALAFAFASPAAADDHLMGGTLASLDDHSTLPGNG